MKKEINPKISLLARWKNKSLQSYQKRKVSLIKNVFHSLFVFIRILRNGMVEELKKIKDGTYENSFFITNIFIGVFLWGLAYSAVFFEEKLILPLNLPNVIELLMFMVMALVVDILVNPFKEFRFLLNAGLTIYLVGYSISILNITINECRKSEQNIHKENIKELKGNQL